MTAEQKVQKLQELLERVRRNAAGPRVPAPPPMRMEAEVAVADAPAPVEDAGWLEESPASREVPASIEEVEAVDLELLDEDIVEIVETEGPPPAEAEAPEREPTAQPEPVGAAPTVTVEVGYEDEEESEPPTSSRRPKVAAASMDEALASAAAQIELSSEPDSVPLKTPPPESGRQVAGPPSAQLQAPPVPVDVHPIAHLDEPDEFLSEPPPPGPTVEQLGATIELPDSEGPELELAPPVPVPEERAKSDELEAPIPSAEERAALAGPAAAAAPESGMQPPAPSTATAPSVPEVHRRPAVVGAASAAEFVGSAEPAEPQTFLQMLDASLSL